MDKICKINENGNDNYQMKSLLSDECYFFFPKEDDILLNIQNFSYKRFYFHVKDFTIFEKNLLKELSENYLELEKNSLFQRIKDDNEYLLRYIHLSNNNLDKTILLFNRYSQLTNNIDFSKEIIFTDSIEYILKAGLLHVIGRDKRFNPILVNNIEKINSFNNYPSIEFIKSYIFYIYFIVEHMLLPGQIEQITWIIKIDKINKIPKIFELVFEYIQLIFPCRFNNIFFLTNEKMLHHENLNNFIKNIVVEYNKDMINITSINSLRDFNHIFSREIIKTLESDITSNICYPPIINHDIIFDNEEERNRVLLSRSQYVDFISIQENISFYKPNNAILNKNIVNEINCMEFKIENFETFNKNPVKIIKNDPNNIETEENSKTSSKDNYRINEKIKMIKNEYNKLKLNRKTVTNKNFLNNEFLLNRPKVDDRLAQEIRSKMANKSHSFMDNESCIK